MNLTWKNNELYAGRLYVGEVNRIVPEGWRAYKHLQEQNPDKLAENNRASRVDFYTKNEAAPWRCWMMTEPDGEELDGRCAGEGEARVKLCQAVRDALADT